MFILEQLKADYAQFPKDQSYELYAENVYFKDPLNQFRGVQRYRKMVQFIDRFFINVKMDLHEIQQSGSLIKTRWTLRWQAPVPWKPKMSISGRSELQLDEQGLVTSHIDFWDCSRWSVLMQLFNT